jgi:hypothetical protein
MRYARYCSAAVSESPQCTHGDFVEMPRCVRLRPAFAKVRRDHRFEMVDPAADRLVGDRDAALRQQIFDVAKAQGEPEIEPDRMLDDLKREPVPIVADFLHSLGYRTAATMPFESFQPISTG